MIASKGRLKVSTSIMTSILADDVKPAFPTIPNSGESEVFNPNNYQSSHDYRRS